MQFVKCFDKKNPENFFPGFYLFAPYELASLARFPSVDALLVHNPADFQGVPLCSDPLADVDVVDAFAEPDADVAFATHFTVQDAGNFLSGLDFDAGDADLPASLVFYDLTIPKSQTFVILNIADGADIDSSVGSVLHNSYSFLFLGLPLPFCTLIIAQDSSFVNR